VAREKGKVRENPAASIRLVETRSRPRSNTVSKETVRTLLENCPDPQLTFILYCGVHCGLRKGEINAVRRDWIHLRPAADEGETGRLDVRIRKKGTLGPTRRSLEP
jgi:integrase